MSEYDDYERDDYDQKKDSIVVFRDLERIGGRGGCRRGGLTSIEGSSLIAKKQEKMYLYDREAKIEDMIGSYFNEIRNSPQGRGFGDSSLDHICRIFQSLPNKKYKNPYMLVLAYILSQTINRNGTKLVEDLIKETQQENISLADVIRYYRLLQSNPLLR